MVGAFFLPNNAFAANNEPSEDPGSKKAAVQVQKPEKPITVKANISEKAAAVRTATPVKPEKAKSLEKPNVVDPEPANINKAKENKNNSSQKEDKVLKDLPEQAKGHLKTAIKNTEKAARGLGSPKEKQENKGQDKKKQNTIQKDRKSADEPKKVEEIDEVINQDYHNELVGSKIDETNFSTINQDIASKPLVSDSPIKENTPSSEEKVPDFTQVLNQTQRASSTGAQAPDRVGNGLTTISFLDKWFVDWSKTYQNHLVLPNFFRDVLMNSQWVNAPPSPPPQSALLVQTVNRS
jgi:hypothetical protein